MTSTETAGSVTTEPALAAPADAPLAPAAGSELLGEVHGTGYAADVSLVRRADGQIVQLGPLLYAVLEAADGRRSNAEVAAAASRQLGRRLDEQHVQRIADKLAAQGLLAGSEAAAPPRRNPLLALRWKVLVTNPRVTGWLTAPFTVLFRPWVMWPVLASFGVVCWYVLFDKGLAEPGAEAFRRPGLLLLIFAIGVVSAGFHELGHAAACRYSGATPGGMGFGIYLVWPAFYTDVTDAYRLDRRSRLRVDLGGLYFNAVMAVAVSAIWLATNVDALLLAVALQLILMVKQLSPVIRADGYHILADATGVPDLFAHLGPTLRRLVPGAKRSPSALTGKARALVTIWVLVVVPVLLSLMAAAILLLPRLATSAWESGRAIADSIPHQAGGGHWLSVLADLLRMAALVLPVLGTLLIGQRLVRGLFTKARAWSADHPARRAIAVMAGVAVVAGIAWAWWPSGQYQPVRSTDRGTLPALVSALGAPDSVARPVSAGPLLQPGRYVALAMVPTQGVSAARPALLFLRGSDGSPVAVMSATGPAPLPDATQDGATPVGSPTPSITSTTVGQSPGPVGVTAPVPAQSGTTESVPPQATSTFGTTSGASGNGLLPSPRTAPAAAFPFKLPAAPGPGDTQALATNQTDGGVVYKVAYAVITVSGDDPVTANNSAFALASCDACTTVAVAFQVVLVVGESHAIAPIDAAVALNQDCPACVTTAIADQLVVTLTEMPSQEVLHRLQAALRKLDLIRLLGPDATPAQIAAAVLAVQRQVEAILTDSGLLEKPLPTASGSASPTATSTDVPSQQAVPSTTDTTPTDSASATSSDSPSPDTPSPTPTPTDSATESPTPTATSSAAS